MDAELRELERLFEAAQQAKPTARLSERSVVELVVKLQQLGILDADLLHTVSGKEYITQDRLRQEMEAEINRLGRVSLVDLASLVGVDLFHCERQADQIVSSSPELMLVQGEVVSTKYWDNLAEEVNETLQEASQVSLGELARRYGVGAELLTGMLSSRIGTIIHAKLEGGQLYTPAYVARVKATVRGALRAITVPTSLQSVWNLLQGLLRDRDDGGNVTGEHSLFHMVLNELVAEEAVKGTLRGSIWTPAVFAHSQRESVEAFYSQNSYITYDALQKLNISQPRQYLQTKYPEGIALDNVFVHNSFISLLDSAAEESVKGGGWLDALDVLPSTFGCSDSGKLLLLCPFVQRALKDSTATLVAETCIVGTGFVKALLEKFQNMLREIQDKTFSTLEVKLEAEPEPELDENETKPFASRSKKNDKKQKDNSIRKEEENEEKSGKSKKKTARHKSSKTPSVKEAVPSKARKGSPADEMDLLAEEKLSKKIIEWYPDLEAAGTEDGDTGVLAKCLADQLRPQLISYMTSLKRAYLGAKTEERRKRIDALQRKIDEDYANLQLFSKAIELFEDDKGMEAVLHKHLLRSTASEITDVFLETQALEHRIENAESAGAQPCKPFSMAVRMSLAKNLPEPLSSAATEMVASLEGKNIGAFDSALEASVTESGLRVRKLDKKGERSLFFAYRKNLSEQVDQEQDPIALLPKVVALLYVQVHGRALQAPGRAMSSAVARLKSAIPDKAFSTLDQYLSETVSLLSSSAADVRYNLPAGPLSHTAVPAGFQKGSSRGAHG
ncbi:hypothetical protein SELMODRAFT_113645 [Selaginella moellendorffii]|uniref:E3 UFM1-protein ligase 1 homolog n=1 Tax=Selaginella moellendorffii TaxID=88036 RepID=D8SCC8_SELML|nr:hypothetical protein SELMODRAFT_113645 [Selaginella moellendorffii]